MVAALQAIVGGGSGSSMGYFLFFFMCVLVWERYALAVGGWEGVMYGNVWCEGWDVTVWEMVGIFEEAKRITGWMP